MSEKNERTFEALKESQAEQIKSFDKIENLQARIAELTRQLTVAQERHELDLKIAESNFETLKQKLTELEKESMFWHQEFDRVTREKK